MSDEGRDVFVQSRNELAKALRDGGVDPLLTGSLLTHFEQLGFFMLGLQAEIRRLRAEVTRQDTRQTTPGRRRSTEAKVQKFPILVP